MTKKIKLTVIFDKPAYTDLQMAYDYIKEDSIVNAERVKEELLDVIKSLPNHPEKYPPDKFKKHNAGNYRAFEKYSYRVAYKITDKEIIILRVRHVKKEPKMY